MIKTINNKDLCITVDGITFSRIPIKTDIIMPNDKLSKIIYKSVKENRIVQSEDIIFIAESVVAITQGRSIKLSDIQPRKLAYFLSSKVSHNPGGVGLTNPEMMEMAFREAGTLRMLMAAMASVLGKVLGKKGWFYIVAGSNVRDIDGPDEYTLPPFNEYVVLAPKDPNSVANRLAVQLGHQVAIVDINDLGQNVLGNSEGLSNEMIARILSDNPLGQSDEQTPIGIIRKVI